MNKINIPDSIQLFIIVILLIIMLLVANGKQEEPNTFTIYLWQKGSTQDDEEGNWKAVRNSNGLNWYYYDGEKWINATAEYILDGTEKELKQRSQYE